MSGAFRATGSPTSSSLPLPPGESGGEAPLLDLDLALERGAQRFHFTLRSFGTALAIVGPSGAGKSTLLRMLAGLERGARGRLVVAGVSWQDDAARAFLPPWRRGVGWVPQDALLFPHASVRQNLAWSGASGTDVAHVAETLEIAPLLERRPRHLSGGERQRVALGRAILSRPKLLLLDEPFAAVERRLRTRLAEEVAELCGERRVPYVLVSHDDGDVALLAREVWRIEEGRLLPA